MDKQYDLITSGYVSMDHLIQVSSPISIGYTSLIENQDNTKIYYGGCGLNIAVAVMDLSLFWKVEVCHWRAFRCLSRNLLLLLI